MNGKYKPGQKVFLTGGNKNLIKEATVLKYTGGFYTIRFENGGGVKVRESRIYPSREEAEAAIWFSIISRLSKTSVFPPLSMKTRKSGQTGKHG